MPKMNFWRYLVFWEVTGAKWFRKELPNFEFDVNASRKGLIEKWAQFNRKMTFASSVAK